MTSVNAPQRRFRAGWIVSVAGLALSLLFVGFVGWRGVRARPFVVPQSAMAPAIGGGDQIRVDASAYGLHLPWLGKLTEGASPQRGDVIVFEWPLDRAYVYVMRVVGLPGDQLHVDRDGWLTNAQAPLERCPLGAWPSQLAPGRAAKRRSAFLEQVGPVSYVVLRAASDDRRALGKHCASSACTVPPGHLFVLGDSRDASYDSRDWGFVPLSHVIGRASSAAPEASSERSLVGPPVVPPPLRDAARQCGIR